MELIRLQDSVDGVLLRRTIALQLHQKHHRKVALVNLSTGGIGK